MGERTCPRYVDQQVNSSHNFPDTLIYSFLLYLLNLSYYHHINRKCHQYQKRPMEKKK